MIRRCWWSVRLLLALGASLLLWPGGVGAQTPLDDRFGADVQGLSPEHGLAAFTEIGLGWARVPVYWASIEPTPGNRNLAALDAGLTLAGQLGLRVILTIRDAPSWAVPPGQPGCAPLTAEGRAALVETLRVLVQRYSGPPYNVKYWEIYNEPDNEDGTYYAFLGGCWGRDPAAYAALLQALTPAVKALDPQAQIVFGGLAHEKFSDLVGVDPGCPVRTPPVCHFNRHFLRDVLANGGGPYFDVLAFHYYPSFRPVWDNPRDVTDPPDIAAKMAALRRVLAQYGVGTKPLLCTECGAWSGPRGQNGDPLWQAEYAVQVAARARAFNLLALIWFWLRDYPQPAGHTCAEANPPDLTSCEGHGLLDATMTPKPAYFALRHFLQRTRTLRQIRPLDAYDRLPPPTILVPGDATLPPIQGYVEGYEFTEAPKPDNSPRQRLWVLWTNPNVWTTRPLAVPNPTDPTANFQVSYTLPEPAQQVLNALGTPVAGPTTQITVGPSPVYLVLPPLAATMQVPVPTPAPQATPTPVPVPAPDRSALVEVPPAVAQEGVQVRFAATPTPTAVSVPNLRPVLAIEVSLLRADGTPIVQPRQPLRLRIRFTPSDLQSRGLDPRFVQILFSPDGTTWQPLPTQVDVQAGEASAEIGHLSSFTLAAMPTAVARQRVFVPIVLRASGGP